MLCGKYKHYAWLHKAWGATGRFDAQYDHSNYQSVMYDFV